MRVIALSALRDFWARPEHASSEEPLRAWYQEVSQAQWQQPADIKADYGSASILKNRRVVFNIKGNDYRLIVAIAYRGAVCLREVHRHPRRIRQSGRRCR